jgi:hypothetical protein
MANRRNQLVVQQMQRALEQMKFEACRELGITIPEDGYYRIWYPETPDGLVGTSHAG